MYKIQLQYTLVFLPTADKAFPAILSMSSLTSLPDKLLLTLQDLVYVPSMEILQTSLTPEPPSKNDPVPPGFHSSLC